MKIHFLPAQTNEEDNIVLSPRIISTNTTEDITKRNEWQREFIVEKEIEYYDEDLRETVRETIQSKIVEAGSGINYLDGDEWKPSNPHFVQTPNGFELVECAYKVQFGRTLFDAMSYEIDGITIPMRIEYIVITDGTNQRTFTPSQNIFGSIDVNDSAVLHFADAFNNIDITYRANKGGFHQDVKVKNLNALKFEGLNNEQAKAYIYTSINNSTFPVNGINIKISDNEINTNAVAFTTTAETKNNQIQFNITEGENTKNLFSFDSSIILDAQGKETSTAARQLYKNPANGTLYLVESVPLNNLQDGSVIDYQTVSGNITTNTTWTANNTYYVSDNINLSAELKIEPGTVIKFASGKSLNVNSGGKIIAEGEPWNYIVFTAAIDTNSGEATGSGTPTAGYYSKAIRIWGGSGQSIIRYCKIAYASVGIEACSSVLSSGIRDNIIYKCSTGIEFYSDCYTQVVNNLITECTGYGIFVHALEGTFNFYSNTIDQCGTGIYIVNDMGCPTVNIKDTIISNWTTYGIAVGDTATMNVDYISYFPINNPDTWKSSGFTAGNEIDGLASSPYDGDSIIGSYYLNSDYASNASYDGEAEAQNRGFDNGKYTYIKPEYYSSGNETIDEDTTWSKQADPEYQSTTPVKRGYHHNRVDYLINDIDLLVTDGTLTIEPGVITVVYSPGSTNKKLWICDDAKIICTGMKGTGEIEYPIFASKRQMSMFIETPLPTSGTTDCTAGIRLGGTESDNNVSYTKFIGLHNGLNFDKNSDFEVTDCVFTGNWKGIATWGYNIKTRNHLFYYNTMGIFVNSTTSGKTHELYNMTFDRSEYGYGIYCSAWTGDTIKVYDTLFSNLYYSMYYAAYVGTIETDYCRYYKVTTKILGGRPIGDHSVDLGNVAGNTPYSTTPTAWADRWFLDQSKTEEEGCIDAGSCDVYTARMSKHTTNYGDYLTDTGILDIGYHYWVFKDDDEDGMNDYWEEANDVDDPEDDPDDDGLNNQEEYILGTNPNDPDTDGDGLYDGWEAYWNQQEGDAKGKLDPLKYLTSGVSGSDATQNPDGDDKDNREEMFSNGNPGSSEEPEDIIRLESFYPPVGETTFISKPWVKVEGKANMPLSNTRLIIDDQIDKKVPGKIDGTSFNVKIPLNSGENRVYASLCDATGIHAPPHKIWTDEAIIYYDSSLLWTITVTNPLDKSINSSSRSQNVTVNFEVYYPGASQAQGKSADWDRVEVTIGDTTRTIPNNLTQVQREAYMYNTYWQTTVTTSTPLTLSNGKNEIKVTVYTLKDSEQGTRAYRNKSEVFYYQLFSKREYEEQTISLYGYSGPYACDWHFYQEKAWNSLWHAVNPLPGIDTAPNSATSTIWDDQHPEYTNAYVTYTHSFIINVSYNFWWIENEVWDIPSNWTCDANAGFQYKYWNNYDNSFSHLQEGAKEQLTNLGYTAEKTTQTDSYFNSEPLPYKLNDFDGRYILLLTNLKIFPDTTLNQYSIMKSVIKNPEKNIDGTGGNDYYVVTNLSPLAEYKMEATYPEAAADKLHALEIFPGYVKPFFIHIEDFYYEDEENPEMNSPIVNWLSAGQSHQLSVKTSPASGTVLYSAMPQDAPLNWSHLATGRVTVNETWTGDDTMKITVKAAYIWPTDGVVQESTSGTIDIMISKAPIQVRTEVDSFLWLGEEAPVYASVYSASQGQVLPTNLNAIAWQDKDSADGTDMPSSTPTYDIGTQSNRTDVSHRLDTPVSPLLTGGIKGANNGLAWVRNVVTYTPPNPDEIYAGIWHLVEVKGVDIECDYDYVGVNSDDDNGNGCADKDDEDPTPKEDNLVRVRIDSSFICGSVTLTKPDEKIKIWKDCNRTNELEWQNDEHIFEWNELPVILWIEGMIASVDINDTSVLLVTSNNGFGGSDSVSLIVLEANLRADSNRSGAVNSSDDEVEYTIPAIMLVNNDNDNGLDSDNLDDTVNGANDVDDLAVLAINRLIVLPDGYRAYLEITGGDVGKIRIFNQRADSGTAIIGPGALGGVYQIPDITTAALTYGVEAADYRSYADEQISLSLVLYRDDGSECARNDVKFVAAPFILLPNTRTNSEIYASDVSEPPFVTDLEDALSQTVQQVSYAAYSDRWVQDEVEIGYQEMPGAVGAIQMNVVLNLPRDRGLDSWPPNELLSPNYGHFRITGGDSEENYGGNLEVSPPLTVEGKSYPLGRIVVGANMESSLTDFLEAQNVQTPIIKLDVDWLYVGHVDEAMSFVPDNAGGFKVLIADTNLAKELLEALVKDDDNTGTATSGGNNTLTDTNQNWDAHKWQDGFIEITAGTGIGQVRQISDNTATTVTVTRNWTTNPNNTSQYVLNNRDSYRAMFFEGVEEIGVATDTEIDTLTDSTKDWAIDYWAGGVVKIIAGTGHEQPPKFILGNDDMIIYLDENWDTQPDETSRYVLVQNSKEWLSGEPSVITVKEVVDNSLLWSANSSCQTNLDSIKNTLKTNLGLQDDEQNSDFIKIPAIFYDEPPVGGGYDAYVPGMVNLLVHGTIAVVPKPFGPKIGGNDIFEEDVKSKLQNIGLTVPFIDCWEYHIRRGEIHCGTNRKANLSTNIHWWE